MPSCPHQDETVDATGKCISCRCDDMEAAVERLLTRTVYGDNRPAYRNMATGALSTPVKSPLEIEHGERA